jgi:hypothetical protein
MDLTSAAAPRLAGQMRLTLRDLHMPEVSVLPKQALTKLFQQTVIRYCAGLRRFR